MPVTCVRKSKRAMANPWKKIHQRKGRLGMEIQEVWKGIKKEGV